MTVGCRSVADELGIDLGAAGLGALEFLEHNRAGATGDDEAIALGVVGSACLGGGRVKLRRHRFHGVEQNRKRPVELLEAAGEHHVLLAPLDHLRRVADAVRGRRAGRGDRIVHAADLERRGEGGGGGRRHGLGHFERPDLGGAARASRVGGGDYRLGRGAARAHNDAGSLVRHVARGEARIADRLLHGDVIPTLARLHEAARLAVDHVLPVDLGLAVDLAAETELLVLLGLDDAALGLPERGRDFLDVVADARHNAHSGDDNTSHVNLIPFTAVRPTPIGLGHARSIARHPTLPHRELSIYAPAAAGSMPASNRPTRKSFAV